MTSANNTRTTSYVFCLELPGSRDPLVTRTFSIPATSRFDRLHHSIQFGFGWRNRHPHEFAFRPGPPGLFDDDEHELSAMRVGTLPDKAGPAGQGVLPDTVELVDERSINLGHIWGQHGRYRKMAMMDGRIAPLWYTYGSRVSNVPLNLSE